MATIRAAMIAGAALVVWLGTIPAQAQNAPLQLLPGAGQATRTTKSTTATDATTRSTTRKSAKKATKAPSKKAVASKADRTKAVAKSSPAPRSNTTRVAQPKAKNSSRTTAATAASPAQSRTRARLAQRQQAQGAITAALPEMRGQENRQEDQEPLAFAPMPIQQSAGIRPTRTNPAPRNQVSRDHVMRDHVMRDGDSVSLIARLPWWRNDRLQPINYGSEEAESQVMAAADAWLLASSTSVAETGLPGIGLDPRIVIADAGEANAIDLALAAVPEPATPTFWNSLIAILGSAAVAAAAAVVSVRYLFTRHSAATA